MESDPAHQRAFLLVRLEAIPGLELRQQQRLPSVERVADDRETRVTRMGANLMRSSGQGTAFQKRVFGESLDNLEQGFGLPALLRIHPHQAGMGRVRRELGFDCK